MSSRHPFDALHMRDCKIGPFQQLRFFFDIRHNENHKTAIKLNVSVDISVAPV